MSNQEPEDSCAGKPIKRVMARLSRHLDNGCKFFVDQLKDAKNLEEVMNFNISIILFSYSIVEAFINERISARVLHEDLPGSEFYRQIQNLQYKLSIQEKWNLITSHNNHETWDAGKEPYQSFELIISLRNELVHYKGAFLEKDTTPTKKINNLMNMFSAKSQSRFIDDDCSSWVFDLLNKKELGAWIYKNTQTLQKVMQKSWENIK